MYCFIVEEKKKKKFRRSQCTVRVPGTASLIKKKKRTKEKEEMKKGVGISQGLSSLNDLNRTYGVVRRTVILYKTARLWQTTPSIRCVKQRCNPYTYKYQRLLVVVRSFELTQSCEMAMYLYTIPIYLPGPRYDDVQNLDLFFHRSDNTEIFFRKWKFMYTNIRHLQ